MAASSSAVIPADPANSMPPLIVTTCSSGKRCVRPLSAAQLPHDRQDVVAADWLRRLTAETEFHRADHLYKGRAFVTAREAARRLGADFGVISAGLGYVAGEAEIPGYDLTIRAGGAASVRSRVAGSFDTRAWWAAIRFGPFATDLRKDAAKRPIVMMALSRGYLELIADDLLVIAGMPSCGLRLFGLSLDRVAPEALRRHVMPYDLRLEGLGHPGTRSDFAPRALAHFSEHILPHATELDAQRDAVLRAMSQAPLATTARPQRRVDDETLKLAIRRLLDDQSVRGSSILQVLRRDAGLSCEQRRFSSLLRAVRAEPQGAPS
jgi:hypothetical protein